MTITFIPITVALNDSLADCAHFESLYRAKFGAHADLIREVVGQNLAFLASVPRGDPWGTNLAVDEQSRTVIGACGFKSGPTPERTVEIAYYTFPDYEGRGFGTQMACDLFRIAEDSGQVARVIAHTLPEPNASNSLLRKAGFADSGEVIDPEDGRVWRFERACNSRRGAPKPEI